MGGSQQQTQQDQTTTQTLNDVATKTFDPQTLAAIQQGFGQGAGLLQNRIGAPMNLQFQDASQLGAGAQGLQQKLFSQQANALNLADQRRQAAVGSMLGRQGAGNNTALLAALKNQGALKTAGQQNQLAGQSATARGQMGLDVEKFKQAALSNQNQQMLAGRQLGSSELTQGLGLLQQLIGFGNNQAQVGRTTNSTQDTEIDAKSRKKSGLLAGL